MVTDSPLPFYWGERCAGDIPRYLCKPVPKRPTQEVLFAGTRICTISTDPGREYLNVSRNIPMLTRRAAGKIFDPIFNCADFAAGRYLVQL